MADKPANDNTEAVETDENDSVKPTVLTDEPAKNDGSEKPKADDVVATKDGDPAKPKEEVKSDKLELKLPDGSLLDATAVEKVISFAKETGLDQKSAQALLERESANHKAYVEGQQEGLAKQSDAWVNEVKNDSEIGGEAFSKNAELAKRVVERFGTQEFKKALDETRLGNHPELVRMLVRIGKSMSEDQLVRGAVGTAKKADPASVLYGKSSKKE